MICLLKQAYEASLQADHQVMADLQAQVRRITTIVEDLACREHARRIREFKESIMTKQSRVGRNDLVGTVAGTTELTKENGKKVVNLKSGTVAGQNGQ